MSDNTNQPRYYFDTQLGQKTEVTLEQYQMGYKASEQYRNRIKAAEKLKGKAKDEALEQAEILTDFTNSGLIGRIET